MWGRGGSLEHKRHLSQWSTACLYKIMGGLGVKIWANLNSALLCKRSWQFANEKGALWKDVIYAEEERGCSTSVARMEHGVELWKAIRRWGHFLSDKLSFVVGNGQRAKFWNDKRVQDIWRESWGVVFSDPNFIRQLTGGE